MFSLKVSDNFKNVFTWGDSVISYSVKVKESGDEREWVNKSSGDYGKMITVSLLVYYKEYESTVFNLLKTEDIELELHEALSRPYIVNSGDVQKARDKFIVMLHKLFSHGYIKSTVRDTIVNEIAGDNTAMRDQLISSIGII